MAVDDESGIEGILQRLERQRNLSFGLKSGKNGTSVDYVNEDIDSKDQNKGMRKDVGELTLFLIFFRFG